MPTNNTQGSTHNVYLGDNFADNKEMADPQQKNQAGSDDHVQAVQELAQELCM